MTAKHICETLGGTWYGGYGLALCPAHENQHSPALSVKNGPNGTLLAKCFAGCQFKDILAALRARGILEGPFEMSAAKSRIAVTRKDLSSQRKSIYARKIWDASRPIHETFAMKYLTSRGITCALPETLRFHSELRHGPTGKRFPALVARIDGTQGFAVHRTYLAPDGSSKAPVTPDKMMLGPAHGGAVRLGAMDDALMIGEGIETCLSACQVLGVPAWAALSTSGMRALVLPERIRDVIILADGDDAGESAALGCARFWARGSRRIRIARPPRGLDFNDLLLRGEELFGDVRDA
jgi:putative DNA primase/helicase